MTTRSVTPDGTTPDVAGEPQPSPNKPLAFRLLGLLFNLNGTIWNLGVAAFAARVGRAFRSSALSAWINRALGGFFVFLGVRLALFQTR